MRTSPIVVPALLALTLALSAQLAAQQPAPRAAVEITPSGTAIRAGETVQFTAVVRDSTGAVAPSAQVTWAAVPFDAAAIDEAGKLTTFRQARVQVFAIVGGGSPAVAVVEVGSKAPATVEIFADQPDLVVGGSSVLTAVARTEDLEPLRDVVFRFRSSDERVAGVGPGGVVLGRALGEATITAEAGANPVARGEMRLRVVPNPVARLEIAGPASTRAGDVIRLRALAVAANNATVAAPVRWSVAGQGASTHSDGAFVAEIPGTYVITATVGAVSATHAVTVAPRVHPWRLEQVAHLGFGDLQAAEHWAIGNALYVSTVGDRLYVFDITNPSSPVKVDSVMVDARTINDISTTADGKIGVLTREGASSRRNGLVFLDLADPLHPIVLSEFTETVTGGVHSAYVDGHYVYATDDATGSMRVIDFADPRQPRQVARWEVPERNLAPLGQGTEMTGGRMLHDVQVKDGLAYLAYWKHGLVILDVGAGIKGGSPESPQLVSRFVYNVADYYPPEMIAGTHAVFRYGNYVFVADEVFPPVVDLVTRVRIKTLGRVHVVDVSDLEHPVEVADYNVQDMGSHNMWVADDVMYIGYYEGGLRAVDVGGELRGDLMAQGREIGSVWTGSPDGYRPNLPMAWGAQPHRGVIYVSDINSGLWVARLRPLVLP